jgi:glycosyltransferase involved in cell wall biosynthesis
MITIYTLTYNEEVMIEFFIQHYRRNFPGCIINIYDNESTDRTVEIAKSYGCNIITYKTNNTLSDSEYLKIKNNCWVESTTDWVLVCDCDELLEINEHNLLTEINNNTTIIKPEGYSLMNNNDEINLKIMEFGFRDFGFDKCVLFNSEKINEINYSPGCHSCSPVGDVKYNTDKYRLLHYKYLSPQYSVDRHKMFGERLSDDNKKRGWGIHYTFSSDSIIEFYKTKQKELIKLL